MKVVYSGASMDNTDPDFEETDKFKGRDSVFNTYCLENNQIKNQRGPYWDMIKKSHVAPSVQHKVKLFRK